MFFWSTVKCKQMPAVVALRPQKQTSCQGVYYMHALVPAQEYRRADRLLAGLTTPDV